MQKMNDLHYGRAWDRRWHHTETVADGTTSVPVRIPADNLDVLVTVVPGSSVDIQFTNDDYTTIDAGNAEWFNWSEGNVSSKTYALIPRGSTAVRCASTGSSKFTVTA